MEILEYLKNRKIIYSSIAVLGIILCFIFMFANKKEENIEIENHELIANTENEILQDENSIIFVDIKGEVINPGVYKMTSNDKIIDVINYAGGLKENANTRYINLAKYVTNEMVIIIYSNSEIEEFNKKEIITIPCECPEIKNDSCIENIHNKSNLININTASKEELMTISGIGESKANAIIEYRNNKLFNNISELIEVDGISETLYNKIKDFITTE